MVSPTQLCWRYLSLPLSQRDEIFVYPLITPVDTLYIDKTVCSYLNRSPQVVTLKYCRLINTEQKRYNTFCGVLWQIYVIYDIIQQCYYSASYDFVCCVPV